MNCDIIMPVWNKKEITQECVESIIKNTNYSYCLIVIDNGSEKEAREYLESLKEDKRLDDYILICNEENLGYTKAVNQGIKISKAKFILLLNNDTLVTKNWLKEMVDIANLEKDIGIVNPASNTLGNSPKSSSHDDIDKCAEECLEHKGKYTEIGASIGFCSLIKKEVIEKIGGWDEEFSPGYFDDTEYSLRATNAGYKSVCARGAYVYHKEHASFRDKNLEKIFKKNRELFYKKCGKPKRILYVIDEYDDKYYKIIEKKSYDLARKANWVWIFLLKALPSLKIERHGNIRRFLLNPRFFMINSVWRILRRQKKKFDRIYVTNKKLAIALKLLRFIHRAKIENKIQG